jgi:hypothetical protein
LHSLPESSPLLSAFEFPELFFKHDFGLSSSSTKRTFFPTFPSFVSTLAFHFRLRDSSDEEVSYSDSEVSTWTTSFLWGDRDRRRGGGGGLAFAAI